MNTTDHYEKDALNSWDLLADAFVGRMPELDWLAEGLAKGAHLLLQGPDGMGKTTLLDRAAEWFAQKTGGRLLSIDSANQPEAIVERLNAWTHQLGELLPGGLNPQLPNAPDLVSQHSKDLLSVLKNLDGIAGRMAFPLGVCFDNFKNSAANQDHPLSDQLGQACKDLRHLGVVVATPEKHLSFAEKMTSRQLGPVDPVALGATIDRHFEKLAAPGAGIGDTCVQLGGPLTSTIMGLARRSWDVAKQAGVATEEMVRTLANEERKLRSSAFGQFWENLPQNEKNVLGEISKGVGDWCTPQHLSQIAGASQALTSLMGKGGVLGALPGGALYFLNSSFRNWVGQASLHLDTSANIPANGEKSFQFNFGMSASATRLQPTH